MLINKVSKINKSYKYKQYVNMSKIKTFALAFGNIAGNMQPQVKEEIMKACNWNSSQYFSMKKNGTKALNEKEEVMVSHIIKKYGFDAFTGERV